GQVWVGGREAAGARDQRIPPRLRRGLRGAEDATASGHAGARLYAVAVREAVSPRVFSDGPARAARVGRASRRAGEGAQKMRGAQRALLLPRIARLPVVRDRIPGPRTALQLPAPRRGFAARTFPARRNLEGDRECRNSACFADSVGQNIETA